MPTASPPSVWTRLLVFALVLGGVAAAGWWIWKKQTSSDGSPTASRRGGATEVLTTKVIKDNYVLDIVSVGTVRAYESINISANVTETLTSLHFEDGDYVKEGTLLATLSDSEEQAMLASAKASLSEEEREIERIRSLVKDGAVPEARLEERRTLAEIAQQRIREAEAKIADRKIVAPFDGWVGLRRISVGALVSPGTVISTLDKIDVVKIDFSLPETVLGQVKPGARIQTRADGAGDALFEGTISQIDSRVDPVTRSVAARAEIANPDLLLRAGMLVTVKIGLKPSESLSIPERSLVPIGSKQFVFTIADGSAKRVEVQIGRRKPGFVEVTGGLKEGQTIITDGLVGLQDGAPVVESGQFTAPVEAFNPEVAQ